MVECPAIELILGGQKSGKSRLAESRAQVWLAATPHRRAVCLATGLAGDDEMRRRIERHRLDRAVRLPSLITYEEPRELAQALLQLSRPDTLVVVDCLTTWLTQALMPPPNWEPVSNMAAARLQLCDTLASLPGPVVMVGNEIGWGVIPMGAEVRHFVDELGLLNQAVAQVAERVTLVLAGCTVTVKGAGRW
ncbi:MAG: bifunctional adenosylcobinamide kinase/adenosylcobinamide-phosphate guanylyltransferase [Pseudomonadota bacterium]|jgi:adenosylcobinamide kinase/adenosylcobinamide-phosphate guanylyltransferase